MWDVLDSYFKDSGLVRQQIDSYNRFSLDLSAVVKDYGTFTIPVSHQFSLGEDVEEDTFWEFKFD
jgi:hypothetical protein